jgi:hypothetical protein
MNNRDTKFLQILCLQWLTEAHNDLKEVRLPNQASALKALGLGGFIGVWRGGEKRLAGRQGLEPRYADPESAVLPLDDLPRGYRQKYNKALHLAPSGGVKEPAPKAPLSRFILGLGQSCGPLRCPTWPGAAGRRIRVKRPAPYVRGWDRVGDALHLRAGRRGRAVHAFRLHNEALRRCSEIVERVAGDHREQSGWTSCKFFQKSRTAVGAKYAHI